MEVKTKEIRRYIQVEYKESDLKELIIEIDYVEQNTTIPYSKLDKVKIQNLIYFRSILQDSLDEISS